MKLTKEQAEKLQTMKTEEEIREYLSHERVALDLDELDAVSGGGFMDFLTLPKAIRDALDENN